MLKKAAYATLFLLVILVLSISGSEKTIYGHWKLVPEQSTDLVTWRYRQLELIIENNNGEVTLLHNWSRRKQTAFVDSMTFSPGKDPAYMVQKTATWAGNWYMGILSQVGSKKKISGEWKDEHRVLQVETEEVLQTSQGETVLKTVREYRLETDGDRITVNEKRATRPTPITMIFERQIKK